MYSHFPHTWPSWPCAWKTANCDAPFWPTWRTSKGSGTHPGSSRDLSRHKSLPAIKELTAFFHRVASEGTPAEALAAFYAYESQVPRVANEKARGLRETYGADEQTCRYFTVHTTADVYHSRMWRQQLERLLETQPESEEKALAAGENAAKALWKALDGIEESRTTLAAA
jgi:pyrroloquinoline-quinone synthase